MIDVVKTDIAISHVLLFAVATAIGCDLGKGDDAGSGIGDDGVAESSDSAGEGTASYDDGPWSGATSGGPADPSDPSATSTSGVHDDEGCGASVPTTGFDTEGWGSSDGGAYDDGQMTTDPTDPTDPTNGGWDTGVATATTGVETTGGTGGETCDVPLSPGGFVYGCECEDPGCDIWFDGVAQIPAFDSYCDCLCQSQGCGGAVGGVGEAGGEEDGGPPP